MKGSAQNIVQNKRKSNKRLPFYWLVGLLAAVGIGNLVVSAALNNDKSDSVRSVKMQNAQIENSTLIIGSHLIHIRGLTDQLYETAMESANDFNQNQMYYKSELANGTWFEISEATSIADITTAGTPVNVSVIEALEFTHKTGQDGITIDLRNGRTVSVFDIVNPYDLHNMPELEPLLIQYQILQDKENKNDSDKIYLDMIKEFYGKSIQNEYTNQRDIQLNALNAYKMGLSPREKPAMWIEKTEYVMTSVDAERRIESLGILAVRLDALENIASGMPGATEEGEETGEEEAEAPPADFFVNSEIVAAIGDCISNVEESISSYRAKCITDSSSTVSAQTEYRYCRELISCAQANDTPGCDAVMESLCNLQNILDGVVMNQGSELDTLTSDLTNASYQKYMGDLQAGVSQAYQVAMSQGASQSMLTKCLSEQKTETNADRLEYQVMLSAQFERMTNTQAQAYALQLIDQIPAMRGVVVLDAASSYLLETVEEHLIWLRKAYGELVKKGGNRSELDTLASEKEDLQRQLQDALDRNDLALANRIEAELEAKQKDMDEALKALSDILSSPNSSETDKAKARAGLSDGSVNALLAKMADDLSGAIRDQEGSGLENMMSALAAASQLDPQAGALALAQVQDALDHATEMDAQEKAGLQSSLIDAQNNMGSGQMTKDELLQLLNLILNSLLGTDFEDANHASQAAAILAMEWYGHEMGYDEALDTAATLVHVATKQNNTYIYQKYEGKNESYMSLKALGKALGYRYIFDDKKLAVTLQKSLKYYSFTVGGATYECVGKEVKNLDALPLLQDTVYIHGTDSKKIFDTKAEYIERSIYAIVGVTQIEEMAKTIYDALMKGGV